MITRKSTSTWLGGLLAAGALFAGIAAQADDNPFIGRWALTIPGGGAGWLGVVQEAGQLKGSILWGGGSVLPVDGVKLDGDKLLVTRVYENRKKDAAGKTITEKSVETITATLDGDNLKLTTQTQKPDGTIGSKKDFTGKRIPALPPAPDLAKVKFGAPIKLFNGQDLTGWKLIHGKDNGWSVRDGKLVNNPAQEEGKPHKNYGNLQTEKEFEDFRLTTEVMVDKGGNSGIYLRGIYEVQVAETYGRKVDPHNMGALYSRITPSEAAEKPPGEWQTLDITLVDRHLTVILNGKKIIDNKPVLGCTGGALWSDEFRPGPIYLQGDHTKAEYRNVMLYPVVK
jgi:hypothetical protein